MEEAGVQPYPVPLERGVMSSPGMVLPGVKMREDGLVSLSLNVSSRPLTYSSVDEPEFVPEELKLAGSGRGSVSTSSMMVLGRLTTLPLERRAERREDGGLLLPGISCVQVWRSRVFRVCPFQEADCRVANARGS